VFSLFVLQNLLNLKVPRLDKDHALADVARDFIHSDSIDRIRREDLDVAPEDAFQENAQAEKVVVRGAVELDEKSMSLFAVWSPRAYEPNRPIRLTEYCFSASSCFFSVLKISALVRRGAPVFMVPAYQSRPG
jgi:hypothetical protein